MTWRRQWILKVAVLLVAATLLGASGWFYFAFYGPTGSALRLAEVFQFRRLQSVRTDTSGAYRFFYATNRRFEGGDGALASRRSARRG